MLAASRVKRLVLAAKIIKPTVSEFCTGIGKEMILVVTVKSATVEKLCADDCLPGSATGIDVDFAGIEI